MGYVYILTNPAMPGLIKIGYTTRTPEERAHELYDKITGVPMPFKVAYKLPCENPEGLEGQIHRKLEKHRVNPYREFFEYSADDAFQLLEQLTDSSWRKWTSHFLTRFKRKVKTE